MGYKLNDAKACIEVLAKFIHSTDAEEEVGTDGERVAPKVETSWQVNVVDRLNLLLMMVGLSKGEVGRQVRTGQSVPSPLLSAAWTEGYSGRPHPKYVASVYGP